MKTASTTVCAWMVLPNNSARYFDQITSYTNAVAPEQKNNNRIIIGFNALKQLARMVIGGA